MKEPLELVTLPDERRAEVEERFLRALAPLGPMLASRLQQGEWRLWMLLPEDFYEAGMSLDDTWGDPDVESATSVISRWIEDFLRRKPGRTVIFENDPARKGDPFLQKRTDAKIIYLGDRVYFYAGSGASVDEIEAVIRYARSACWGIGMVVDSSSSDLPGEINEDDLRDLASKAVSLICDACDGVSYVVAEVADGMSIIPEAQS